nr:exonuclease domain-containing protein [Schaalia odontolytica]
MTKRTPVRDCGETIAPGESARPFARSVVSAALSRASSVELQPSLDAVGTPTSGGHWVVVDLETTGLGAGAEITEIGAVRIRDGAVVDEFSSLVKPSRPIPPFITSLTGITPAMVADADPIASVLEHFLEWSGLGASDSPVLVAHNASFDVGFLRRAARACARPWPRVRVVDTLALARLALPRPLVRNHKLGTVASYFGTATVPEHRALGDARATAEILLGFIDLLAAAGATDVEDLIVLTDQAPARRPSTPDFVTDLPTSPGVYHFIDTAGGTLYVGSASSLKSRVGSYYTKAEKRPKVQRMVSLAAGVRPYPTASILEARIRELRDIKALVPPYNSASRRQGSLHWVIAEADRPRVVSSVTLDDLPNALGPFGTRAHAQRAAGAIARVLAQADHDSSGAILDEAVEASSLAVPNALTSLMERLSTQGLFEAAAGARDELSAYITGVERATMRPILAAPRIVWGARRDGGEPGWILHVASYGRHLSSVVVPPRSDPSPWIDVLTSTEPIETGGMAASVASWAETSLLCAELCREGTRLVEWNGPLPWAQPVDSPLRDGRLRELLAHATAQQRHDPRT